jgi:hypothetical protein
MLDRANNHKRLEMLGVTSLIWAIAAGACSSTPSPAMQSPVMGTQPAAAGAAPSSAAGAGGSTVIVSPVAGSGGGGSVATVVAGRSAPPPTRDAQADDADGGTASPPDASTAPAPHADLGKGDGSDVIAIGDSWMSLSAGAGIQDSLLKASGQKYRVYGVPGTQLLNGQIPGQFTRAKTANPISKPWS